MINETEKQKYLEPIEYILNIDESNIRREELGKALDFYPVIEPIINIKRIVLRLKMNYEKTPESVLKSLISQNVLINLRAEIQKCQSFQVTQPDPKNVRDTIIANINLYNATLIEKTMPLFYNWDQTETDKVKENSIDELTKSITQIKRMEDEGKEVIARMKLMAEKEGANKYSSLFKNKSEEDEKKAKFWMKWLIGIGLLTVLLAIVMFLVEEINILITLSKVNQNSEILKNDNLSFTIQVIFGRLIIFSILFYAIGWINKNYKVCKHSASVNIQKAHALTTFESFIDEAKDSDTKNAVLLKTTEAIFSLQTSGYLGVDNEPQSNTQILEIVRSIAGAEKK